LDKPRLLIILNRLSVGGPATNILSAAAALSNSYTILLIAGEPLKDEQSAEYLLAEYKGFRVQMIPSLRRSVIPAMDIRSYYHIKKIIREFQPHIVHTHGTKPGVVGRLVARHLKVPVIVHTFHGHVFHSYFNSFISGVIVRIERWLSSITTAIVAINQKLQTELVQEYQIANSEKVKLIRLGIETSKFSDEDGNKRKKFRNEFQLQDDEVAIGIVGRLVPVKQHDLFIEIAEQAREISKNKTRFFIVGDGQERENLQKLVTQKKMTFSNDSTNNKANIIFTSWRSDMDVVFAGLDIMMLTSLNEGSPVSIMEAMAASKPVIATNVGGIAELVQNDATGFCCSTKEELLNHLLQLIENSNVRTQMGKEAGVIANQWFSKTYEVNQMHNLYTELLNKSK
jgi:glycosyltransferase involved in cell wall biosynthesis